MRRRNKALYFILQSTAAHIAQNSFDRLYGEPSNRRTFRPGHLHLRQLQSACRRRAQPAFEFGKHWVVANFSFRRAIAWLVAHTCLGRVTADSSATNSYFAFSVFSLTWGMCSSLDTNPNRSKNIGFWHAFGTGVRLPYPCRDRILPR